ncbi:hypothetical protein J8L13_04365 [Bacteroides fragilis]|uniref:hypothetical protein n=1 Tax=Bacteroides fragilis TaxID=817 RepID=UPI00202EF4DE|nr:hypothetical protein [Bacteroides fragilis]MCM0236649.1 hypothetical protein [Bacteroides fragilis]
MIAPTQIRKPENWQDFEKLCKKLWGEIWDCPDTIQRNGRAGQNQCGVDVYGLPKGMAFYYGIQCKGKDDYTNSKLTESEIDEEIKKALNFKPDLKRLIFATTANKDVKIEQYIREKNLNHISNGLFEVYLSSWEDIVDLLEAHRNTYNWYINNCQYKDASDIDVFFEWRKDITIHPQYIKNITTYQYKEPNPLFNLSEVNLKLMESSSYDSFHFHDILNPKSNVDYRWCYFKVNIKNIGSTVIEDYVLKMIFDHKNTAKISDCFYYENNFMLSDAAKAQINTRKDSSREVFAGRDYWNVMEFIPKDKILVQGNHRTFKIGIKPEDGVEYIKVSWKVLSRDYNKQGELIINVTPRYEEKHNTVTVYDKSELKETMMEITPKIVKE